MKKNTIKLIISLLLFFTAFILSPRPLSAYALDFFFSEYQIREIIFGISFILLMQVFSDIKWLKKIDLFQKLRFFGFGLVALWIWGGIIDKFSGSASLKYKSLSSFNDLGEVLLLLLFIVLTIAMLILLKELIFIQQRKKTERNFRILIYIIYFKMFSSVFFDTSETTFLTERTSSIEIVLLSLFILFCLINGFRCKWIHFLKKRQKLWVLFLGILLISFAVFRVYNTASVIELYGRVIGSFLNQVFIFYGIYASMALTAILFQLPSAGIMDRRIKDIKLLQNLSASIGTIFNQADLIAKSTELSRDIVNADFTIIELKNKDGYKVTGWNGIRKKNIGKIPDSFFKKVRDLLKQEEDTLFINDFSRDHRIKNIKDAGLNVGSVLAVSIKMKNEELGALYSFSYKKFAFNEESRGIFKAVADQVGVALNNLNLFQVTVEQQAYKEELRVAHEAQKLLHPREMPQVKGIEIKGRTKTANEIGGDIYDYYLVGNDRLDIIIGDVSGKGASAAFYMAELKGVIQALAPHFVSPRKILSETNKFVWKNFKRDMFATMVYAIYKFKERELKFVRAGHPPLCWLSENEAEWLEPAGLGLGLSPSKLFESSIKESRITLKPGESVFFHTDGIDEARNRKGGEFGEDALKNILFEVRKFDAQGIIERVINRIELFTQGVSLYDDITMVVLNIKS